MEIKKVDPRDPSHIAVEEDGKLLVELKGPMAFYAAGVFISLIEEQRKGDQRRLDFIALAIQHTEDGHG